MAIFELAAIFCVDNIENHNSNQKGSGNKYLHLEDAAGDEAHTHKPKRDKIKKCKRTYEIRGEEFHQGASELLTYCIQRLEALSDGWYAVRKSHKTDEPKRNQDDESEKKRTTFFFEKDTAL